MESKKWSLQQELSLFVKSRHHIPYEVLSNEEFLSSFLIPHVSFEFWQMGAADLQPVQAS